MHDGYGYALIAIGVAGILFVLGEYVRKRFGLQNEVSRKLVHVLHGVVIMLWGYWLGIPLVVVTELLFLLAVIFMKNHHWFAWLWRVRRKSWGEYCYPVGVVFAAVFADNFWVYAAAVLVLALGDSVAALAGKTLGRHRYKVFGQTKTVEGSLAFGLVVSIIFVVLALVVPSGEFIAIDILPVALIAYGLLLAAVENAGWLGLDNATLPIATVLLLNASL